MRISCPSCDESYRIDPVRLPGPRVRTTCLGCGQALFLRARDGARGGGLHAEGRALEREAPAVPPAPAAPVVEEEIPLWSEPRPPAAQPVAGAPPPAEPFYTGATGAPPAPPFSEAPEKPLAPYLETAEKPLVPYLEPAFETPREAPPRPGPGGFMFTAVGDVSARARRLARALVSDILVYHPKKVEQGVHEGNLKELMREEVEKSWDEYCERMGADEARANRRYFVSALNEILARGKNVF